MLTKEILHKEIDLLPDEFTGEMLDFVHFLKEKQVKEFLERMGHNYNSGSVEIGCWRMDIMHEVDLIEEVARIYGYDQIPAVPKITITLEKKYDESVFTDEIREIATGLGLYEILNNPLIDERSASFDGRPIKILNPQSVDMAYLRTSLIPGGLIVAANNINKGEKNLSF